MSSTLDNPPPSDIGQDDGRPHVHKHRLIAFAGIAALILTGLLLVLLPRSSNTTDADEATGNDVLTMPFTHDDGSTGTLADFSGQPVVVNFFAAWCTPCRAEIPEIEAIHEAADNEVTVLGVSHDIDESSWRSFVNETGLTYQTVFQPSQEIYTTLDLVAMPSTILLDPSGQVVHAYAGPLDAETLSQLIGDHLGVEMAEVGA